MTEAVFHHFVKFLTNSVSFLKTWHTMWKACYILYQRWQRHSVLAYAVQQKAIIIAVRIFWSITTPPPCPRDLLSKEHPCCTGEDLLPPELSPQGLNTTNGRVSSALKNNASKVIYRCSLTQKSRQSNKNCVCSPRIARIWCPRN